MTYHLETTARFDREFKKLLTANRSGQWRYRIGDYRLICEIQNCELVILALSDSHMHNLQNKKV